MARRREDKNGTDFLGLEKERGADLRFRQKFKMIDKLQLIKDVAWVIGSVFVGTLTGKELYKFSMEERDAEFRHPEPKGRSDIISCWKGATVGVEKGLTVGVEKGS
ncbi:hypothetical protein RHGRI_036561 [Rhododendron griersonianum]|uniref:Uncharacterized protein n=1 Tax=Rhododendron griersonianum TaxID=479676 RepID=A0AAV6HRY4_9ERIC|nr:hypothetical protein RHGRI_036561 [Rhododendron griersonianum]